jgi:hypothetical protein
MKLQLDQPETASDAAFAPQPKRALKPLALSTDLS